MIALKGLSFEYPGESTLFGGLDWSVERGCSWSVVGASGAGKTTLLHLLAGLLSPTQGTVAVDGILLERPRPRTGLILQHLGLMPWSTVEGNVRLGMRIRRFYGPDGRHAPRDWSPNRAQTSERVDQWLGRMRILELRRKFPAQLSGGEKQRVAIARTMVLDPDLLLMDEPFSSLDATTRRTFQELMLRLEEETGHTRVLVTHDVAEAVTLGQKILILGHGGVPRGIVSNPCFGSSDARETPEFMQICEEIQQLVDV